MTSTTTTIQRTEIRESDRVRFIPVGQDHEIDLVVYSVERSGHLSGYRRIRGRGQGMSTHQAPERVELVFRPTVFVDYSKEG